MATLLGDNGKLSPNNAAIKYQEIYFTKRCTRTARFSKSGSSITAIESNFGVE